MVVNDKEIYQKMKNKTLLGIEKKYYKMRKNASTQFYKKNYYFKK